MNYKNKAFSKYMWIYIRYFIFILSIIIVFIFIFSMWINKDSYNPLYVIILIPAVLFSFILLFNYFSLKNKYIDSVTIKYNSLILHIKNKNIPIHYDDIVNKKLNNIEYLYFKNDISVLNERGRFSLHHVDSEIKEKLLKRIKDYRKRK